MSQHITSSLAATTAWPAPVAAPWLLVQRMLDELEVIRPNDLECSYFLRVWSAGLWNLTLSQR